MGIKIFKADQHTFEIATNKVEGMKRAINHCIASTV